LPRGGVPVAYAVAEELEVPLDIMLVRKLGVPGYEEYAMGAITSNGQRVINPDALRMLPISDQVIDAVAHREWQEIQRREKLYRGDRAALPLQGRTVILIDDGLATGSTMLAAVQAVRGEHPARIIVAVPVAAFETCEKLRAEVDDLICLHVPEDFRAVGSWYDDFAQTTDDEVIDLLQRVNQPRGSTGQAADEHRD
jgi:predicted phosphoribosyltransferase